MKLEKLMKELNVKYILIFVTLFLLGFLLVKNIPNVLILIGLTLVTALVVFFNYLLKIPIDFSPVFFLSILITSSLGLGYTILFVILAGFVPSLFSGDFESDVFVYMVANILVNLISIPINLNFLLEGIILSFLYGILVTIISAITGSESGKELFVNAINFLINVLYFWKFGQIILSLLS